MATPIEQACIVIRSRGPTVMSHAEPPDRTEIPPVGGNQVVSAGDAADDVAVAPRPTAAERPDRATAVRAQSWIPLVSAFTAVAALLLSIVIWLDTQRQPRLAMSLPSLVRISPTDVGGILYLQPSLAVVDRSDSSILVSRLRLELVEQGVPRPSVPQFYWREFGEFYYSSEGREVNYRMTGDAVPLLVSRSEPQGPLIDFRAPIWSLNEGRWSGALVALGADDDEIARAQFCIDVTVDRATQFNEIRGTQTFLVLGSDPADDRRVAAGPCYS